MPAESRRSTHAEDAEASADLRSVPASPPRTDATWRGGSFPMSSGGSSSTARKIGLLQVRACPLHTPPAILSYHAVFFPRPDASRDRRGGDARDRDQVRARCARDCTWHGDVARGNNALNPPSEATLPPPRRSPSLPDIFLVLRCFPAISALRSSWAAGTRDPARARGY